MLWFIWLTDVFNKSFAANNFLFLSAEKMHVSGLYAEYSEQNFHVMKLLFYGRMFNFDNYIKIEERKFSFG